LITFTGEYDPAVSSSTNLVPSSISTYLKLSPFVLTLLPLGSFYPHKLLSTNVFPLSYKPTTATIAPCHWLNKSSFNFKSWNCTSVAVLSFRRLVYGSLKIEVSFINFSEKWTFQPLIFILVIKSISSIQSYTSS
jgi:hypothetical protein